MSEKVYDEVAYTLMVPAGAIVDDQGGVITRYRDLTETQQKHFLKLILSQTFEQIIEKDSPTANLTHNFEQHKDKRYHVHGSFYKVTSKQMEQVQLCINNIMGYALKNQKIFYYKLKNINAGWQKYATKEKYMQVLMNLPLDDAIVGEGGSPDGSPR